MRGAGGGSSFSREALLFTRGEQPLLKGPYWCVPTIENNSQYTPN